MPEQFSGLILHATSTPSWILRPVKNNDKNNNYNNNTTTQMTIKTQTESK